MADGRPGLYSHSVVERSVIRTVVGMPGETVGTRLRRLRGERGCSLSELSRRSGVGKGTISELENGRRGARLDTLFALTTALGAPLGALLADESRPTETVVRGDSVAATLLHRWPTRLYQVEVYRAELAATPQESAPHAPGVLETVTVVEGRVRVGVVGGERELRAGESLRYRGDLRHRFAGIGGAAEAILLMHYPVDPGIPAGRDVASQSEKGRATVPLDQQLPARSQLVQQHLIDAGLATVVRELPDSTRTAIEAAAALGSEVGAIASSLVFLADGQPLLVMTSGRHRVDTDVLAAGVGATAIEMATAKQVRAITGQAIGGVAPVGHPAPVRTVIDEALRDYETIWAAAGTPRTVMPLTFDELVSLTRGKSCRVAAD